MLSFWELAINHKAGGKLPMNLESILSSIKVNENRFNLNNEFKTIRYITETEYRDSVDKYVEPNFNETTCSLQNSQPRFILFSVPGATGKTALAKHICYTKNGIYWDLPDNKVAEYSLQGALQQAIGADYLSGFFKSIKDGKDFLVIDAFDEAEAGSGRTGIEFFLRDLNTITNDCNHICAILMARTESAIFIKNYFTKEKIPFKHYEVGLFAEYNAKTYMKNKLLKLGVNITSIVTQCIEEQFMEIRRIFGDDAKSFIGYAPVLDALAFSYDDDKNTLSLLKTTKSGENNFGLMNNILRKLLIREHEKFLKALNIKVSTINYDSIQNNLYAEHEQIARLFEMIVLSEATTFVDIYEKFPIEYYEEYLDVVNIQLPQHPFIQGKDIDNDFHYDFTGAAFKDFVLAYILADENLYDFVDDYISIHPKYCPSQMLIEFYSRFSENKVRGKHIPLMYNSFKSLAQMGDKVSVYINGDATDCSVEFNLIRENKIISLIELKLLDFEEGIFLNQLSNCYIDVDGKVYIGNSSSEARISNSDINCNEIIWRSNNISIEAYSPGSCLINTTNMSYTTNAIPHFEIKTDENKNLKVCSPSLNSYFRLLAYKKEDTDDSSEDEFVPFANLIRRIFSCLRSHSKDTPARKMDFIDNRIINLNPTKKKIMDFLLSNRILFTDEQDWLYKLDTTKISDYKIKWNDVREGDFESLRLLYNIYVDNGK